MIKTMAKRFIDIVVSCCALIVFSPVLSIILFLIWRQDGRSPLYFGERICRNGLKFQMIKLRSMVIDADLSGIESTGASDPRITSLGHFIRRSKLDELPQLWNVLCGDMSLVGPRPNTCREVGKYTLEEKRLLMVRPGITDIASIVFSDEGEILKNETDANEAYSRLIRPWKSQLALLYVENNNVILDLQLLWLTVLAIVNKPNALEKTTKLISSLGASEELVQVSRRIAPL